MHICSHKYHGIRRVSAGLAKSRGRAATALLELAISKDIQTKRREVLCRMLLRLNYLFRRCVDSILLENFYIRCKKVLA